MNKEIVTREAIYPGDRVFTIEDRPVGVVTGSDRKSVEIAAFDGVRYRVPMSEVFTSTEHCVTLVFHSSALPRYVCDV